MGVGAAEVEVDVLTGERALLLVFPNVFEPWFLLVAALHHRRDPVPWTRWRLAGAIALAAIFGPTLFG